MLPKTPCLCPSVRTTRDTVQEERIAECRAFACCSACLQAHALSDQLCAIIAIALPLYLVFGGSEVLRRLFVVALFQLYADVPAPHLQRLIACRANPIERI